MSISSAQTCYSTTSVSSIDTVDLSNITISGGGYSYGAGQPAYTVGIGSGITLNSAQLSALSATTCTGTISIGNIGSISAGFNTWSTKEEWINCFPEWSRIEDMCKQYPGLEVAFAKFKTTYLLVKNHYDTPEDERPLP